MSHLSIFRSLLCKAARMLSLPFFSPSPPLGAAPPRILIIKLCCLGDALLATPAVAQLRRAFPQAQLDMLIGRWSSPAVSSNPDLNNLVDAGCLGGGNYPWKLYLQLARRLRSRRYHMAVVLERSVLTTLLPLLAGIPHRVGLDSEGRGFPLTVRVPCPVGKHEAALYLDVARAASLKSRIDYPVALNKLAFFPSPQEKTLAEMLTKDLRRPLLAIHPGGAINPGATMLSKRWPPERFAAVADRLAEGYGATVVLTGGPSDSEAVRAVRDAMARPAYCLSDQLTFGQLGAVLGECDLFIGNDSGPAHLAAAAGARVVVVFGPTDPRVYGPYGDVGEAVWTGLPCSPCFSRGRFPTCSHLSCISSVTVDMVWEAAQRQLQVAVGSGL